MVKWLFIVAVVMAAGAGSTSVKGRGGKGGSGKGRSGGEGKGNGGGADGDRRKGRKPSNRKGDGNGERCVDEGDEGSDGESFVEGFHEVGQCSKKMTFERAARSCSQGDYGKKPEPNARPTVHFTSKTRAKHTLGYIVKEEWDENTVKTKGAAREAFYDRCVKIFKDYYKYPEGWTEVGDSVVKAHLRRNFRSYLNKMKERLDENVSTLRESGYSNEEIDWSLFRPHFFSRRVWASICEYWGLPEFKKMSKYGKEARKKMEYTSRTGAIPYDQRRQELDAEREAKGELPLTDEEFMDLVYNPDEPAVIALKEKMKEIRASQLDTIPEMSEPPSPETLKKIQYKNDVLVTLQARPPKKGKAILHPQQTVAELVGAHEAAKYCAGSQKMVDSPLPVSDKIYMMMSDILDEVRQMVTSLPMREVTQPLLDEEVSKLATTAFPDPSQCLLRTHYMRAATGLLRQILKDNDKVIVEAAPVGEASGHDGSEDEDYDAHMFPID